MLDFCAAHHIGADVETIEAQQIDKAYDRMLKSDVRYRFVITSRASPSLKEEASEISPAVMTGGRRAR